MFNINWGTVVSVVVALLIIIVAYHFMTKRRVDASTGLVKTSFLGFEGDKKDNMDGE